MRIVIVEDEKAICDELKLILEKKGYEAICVEEFNNVVDDIVEKAPDLVLLDINLPGQDGQSILRSLRSKMDVPVIMVTSQNTEMDEVICLSYGADDFIAKPYNPAILLLHIEAVLKRYTAKTDRDTLSCDGLTIDVSRGVIRKDNVESELTKNELGILTYLIRNRGKIVTRDEIINYLWDSEEFVDDNTLTVNINRVRKKLADFDAEDMIKTKRGQGYILE